jgi:hypothetical protein
VCVLNAQNIMGDGLTTDFGDIYTGEISYIYIFGFYLFSKQ